MSSSLGWIREWARSDTWLQGAYRCGSPFIGKPDTGRYGKQGKELGDGGGYLHDRRILGLKWVSSWGSFRWSLKCPQVFVLPSLMRYLLLLSKYDTCSFRT